MREVKKSVAQLSGRVRNIIVTGLFVFASTVTPLFSELTVQAAGESLGTVANKVTTLGEDIAITDLQVGGTGNENISITVHAPSGSFEVVDPTVTTSGRGTNAISLSGTRNAVNTTLSTLVYTSEGLGIVTITADFGNNVGNVIFNNGEGGNGHAYIVVNNPLPWTDAKTASESYTFGGQPGYLATITSSQENDYVYAALNQQTGWIGANDIAVEGSWGWRVGPEENTQFWSGDFEGSSTDGEYNNWAEGEPNNGSGGTEDCAQFWNEGYWNDLNCTTPRPYVVEFGGDGPLEPIQETFTVTTVRETISVASCEQLFAIGDDKNAASITLTQDIDCENQTVSPLFRDDRFMGIFDGAGHTISNFVINEPTDSDAGFLASVDGATIRDLTIKNAKVTGQDQAGVLIGTSHGSLLVDNVHVRSSVMNAVSDESDDDADDVGGLIGEISVGDDNTVTVTGSSFEGRMNIVDGSAVGGLIGSIEVSEASAANAVIVEKSYADAVMSVGSDDSKNGYSEEIGGLVGKVDIDAYGHDFNVILRDVYSWSKITQVNQDTISFSTGGLVGAVYTGATEVNAATLKVHRAYANGAIQASGSAGGLIGFVEYDAYTPEDGTVQIENSFAAGKVSVSESYQGGLIGITEAESAWNGEASHIALTNTYFDQTRTGQTECAGDTELAGCSAVNTTGSQNAYFINNTASAPLSTWDFDGIWVANTHVMPTFKAVIERDGDGVSDDIEMAAPNNGDGNNDGIADVDQSNVSSLIDPKSNKYVTLAVDASCDLSDVFVSTAASHDSADGQYAYSTGFVNFTATGCASDGTDVQLFYHGVDSRGLIARKYNPNNETYFTITSATIANAASPLVGTMVSYTVVDNGDLDTNATEGVITDPVGLANTASAVGAPNTGFEKQSQLPAIAALLSGIFILGSAVAVRQLHVKTKK